MRRRRWTRRVRHAPRRSDWVQAVFACPQDVALTKCVDGAVPAGTSTEATLLDATDLLTHTDALTVLRVVGDVGFEFRPGTDTAGTTMNQTSLIIFEGIYVAETDNAGNFLAHEAQSSTDAEASWMWRNTRWLMPRDPVDLFLSETSSLFGRMSQGDMHHLDIGVHRKLNDRQLLMYTCVGVLDDNTSLTVNPAQCRMVVNLRTLVRSKG